MPQAPDLVAARELARAELPGFALRHGPDLQVALPGWRFEKRPDEPFRSGGCGILALSLRKWSRSRLSVLAFHLAAGGNVAGGKLSTDTDTEDTDRDGWHLFGMLPAGAASGASGVQLWDVNEAERTWQQLEPLVPLLAPAEIRTLLSPLPRLRQYQRWRSWPAMAAFIDQLVDMMDEELGDGESLFADLPPAPLDGSLLL